MTGRILSHVYRKKNLESFSRQREAGTSFFFSYNPHALFIPPDRTRQMLNDAKENRSTFHFAFK